MSTSESAQQLVVFSLGDEEYALPITQVQEIIRYTEPRAVASEDPCDRGVISLRGKIVPVCDLASRLGLGSERAAGRQDRDRRDPGGTAGVIVDDVAGGAHRGLGAARRGARPAPSFVEAIAKVGRPARGAAQPGRHLHRRSTRGSRLGVTNPCSPRGNASSSPTTRPSCADARRRAHGGGLRRRRDSPATATRRSRCAAVRRPDVLSLDLRCRASTASACCARCAPHGSPIAVVVVSAFSPAHGARAVDALAEGAFELVAKPSAGDAAASAFVAELGEKIRAAASPARAPRGGSPRRRPPPRRRPGLRRRSRPADAATRGRRHRLLDRRPAALAELVPAASGAARRSARSSSSTCRPASRPRWPPGSTRTSQLHRARGGRTATGSTRRRRSSPPAAATCASSATAAPGLTDEPAIGGLRPRADLTIGDAAASVRRAACSSSCSPAWARTGSTAPARCSATAAAFSSRPSPPAPSTGCRARSPRPASPTTVLELPGPAGRDRAWRPAA